MIDVDAKKHMYIAEVVAHRNGEGVVGAKEFSPSGRSFVDSAAARAERQLGRVCTIPRIDYRSCTIPSVMAS